jgi:hypothetical protein
MGSGRIETRERVFPSSRTRTVSREDDADRSRAFSLSISRRF